jgi:hypothetical protein
MATIAEEQIKEWAQSNSENDLILSTLKILVRDMDNLKKRVSDIDVRSSKINKDWDEFSECIIKMKMKLIERGIL